MRLKKYVCMKEGCDFFSEDSTDAYDHMEQGSDHVVAEVLLEDGKLSCHKLVEERPEEEGYFPEED
jgi:hypothetical protein